MDQIWNKLIKGLDKLSAQSKDFNYDLNEGVTDKKIASVEKTIGKALPEDFKQFYKVHNGEIENGQGILRQTNGMKYKGRFVNGKKDGEGLQEDAEGVRYKGGFKEGLKHGDFIETDAEGKEIRRGTYKEGRLVNETKKQ